MELKEAAITVLVTHIESFLVQAQGGGFGPLTMADLQFCGILHRALEGCPPIHYEGKGS